MLSSAKNGRARRPKAKARHFSGNGIKVARLVWDQKVPVQLPASPTILKFIMYRDEKGIRLDC